MDIRKNMALSLLLHTLLIIPVFSLAGRIGDSPEVSSSCVTVSLLNEMRDRESDKHSDESNIKPVDIAERKISSPITPLNALPKAASEGAFLHNAGPLVYDGPPTKQGDIGQKKDYYALITAAIEKAKTYPFLARKKKIEGTVIAAFRINAKGYPQDINIRKSSGFEILDSAAMKIVIKAAPFPHVVEPVEIPITFRITD